MVFPEVVCESVGTEFERNIVGIEKEHRSSSLNPTVIVEVSALF